MVCNLSVLVAAALQTVGNFGRVASAAETERLLPFSARPRLWNDARYDARQ